MIEFRSLFQIKLITKAFQNAYCQVNDSHIIVSTSFDSLQPEPLYDALTFSPQKPYLFLDSNKL